MFKNKKNLKTLFFSIFFVLILTIMIFSGINNVFLVKDTYAVSDSDCVSAGGKMVDGNCCPSSYTSSVLSDIYGGNRCFSKVIMYENKTDGSPYVSYDYATGKYFCTVTKTVANSKKDLFAEQDRTLTNEQKLNNAQYCFNDLIMVKDIVWSGWTWYENLASKDIYFTNWQKEYYQNYYKCLEDSYVFAKSHGWYQATQCGNMDSDNSTLECTFVGPLSNCYYNAQEGAACYKYKHKQYGDNFYYEWVLNHKSTSRERAPVEKMDAISSKAQCDALNKVTVTFHDTDGNNKVISSKKLSCDVFSLAGECSISDKDIGIPTKKNYKFEGWYEGTKPLDGGCSWELNYIGKPDKFTLKDNNKNYYACYTYNGPVNSNVTITYNAVGGSVTPASVSVVKDTMVSLPKPIQKGYYFLGWYDSISGGTKVGDAGSYYKVTKDITLYAKWSIHVANINYNANGGSVSPTKVTPQHFSTIGLPTPTRSGYKFLGWYTSASGGTKIGDAGDKYTILDKDETLYAHWEKIAVNYKVKYDANQGKTTVNEVSVDSGKTTVLPQATRSDYKFLGWYTASSGGTKVGNVGDTYKVTKNITLYAHWSKNVTTYRVTYNSNEGEAAFENIDIVSGEKVILPEATRNGYKFLGWYTSIDSGTKIGNAGDDYIVTKNVTLFAQWEKEKLEVTYNANGGTVDTESVQVYLGEKVILPGAIRNGYKFLGWYIAPASLNSLGNAGDEYLVEKSVTLYARWGELTSSYNVTFKDHDGKELYVESCSIEENKDFCTIMSPEDKPLRSGYTFIGWAPTLTDCVKNNVWSVSSKVDSDSVMYACYQFIESNNNGNNILVIIIILVLVLGGGAGGFWYFKKLKNNKE